MWAHEYRAHIAAAPDTLWPLLSDVDGWVRWNAGIESIVLEGPLAVGARFRMTPPGEPTLTSTIVELEPGRVLTDLTELDGVAVRVEHRLEPEPAGGTTVSYRIGVSGAVPDDVAAEIGRAVSADFPEVLDGMTRFAAGPGASPGYLLWCVTLTWQRAVAAALGPLGLTHVQFVLLVSTWWLDEHEGAPSQVELARHAALDVKMTSQVVRTLERKQLLTREVDPADARARRLRPTPAGADLARRAVVVVEQVDQDFFDDQANRRTLGPPCR